MPTESRALPVSRLRSKSPNPPDWVDVHSGYGDGGYPCYWGIGDDGEVVSLTVDFLVAAAFLSETVVVKWDRSMLGKPIAHPLLVRLGMDVELVSNDEFGDALRYRGGEIERARLTSTLRRVLADTEDTGSGSVGAWQYNDLDLDLKKLRSVRLEFTVSTGYRNP